MGRHMTTKPFRKGEQAYKIMLSLDNTLLEMLCDSFEDEGLKKNPFSFCL